MDRYAGIPGVTLLGAIRRKRPGTVPSRIKTIGLLKAGAIGDTVLMSAAIADLRMAFPSASVVFFCGNSNFEIARMLQGVDHVIRVPTANFAAGVKCIRSIAVDVMLDFGQWSRLEALLSFFSKAAFTIGFCTAGQHRHHGYDLTVKHSCDVHEIENFRRLVRALGVETGNPPSLRTREIGGPPAADYVVFHLWPGGRLSKLKQWPSEKWLRLIEEFVSWGLEIVLTGAPSDRGCNAAIIERVQPWSRGFVRNVAGLNLQQTAATLAHSRMVVSVNTGVMHMAAALGASLVALHGPTSSKRWGPISEKAIIVDSPAAGCGYLNLGWEYPPRPPACMECIRYEDVRDACRELLQRQKSSLQDRLANVPYVPFSEKSTA